LRCALSRFVTEVRNNPWLHRFACLTAVATLLLIVVGGLVTSHGAGMAVPDWPNSYGYNMFLFPISKWVGGILYEHSHRLIATFVGLLTVILTRWLGGSRSRVPLMVIGVLEIAIGEGVLRMAPEWSNAGHFLAGIGGVVLLTGIVWIRSTPAPKPLPALGWIAFVGVQVQGLLGGLRVVLFKDEIGIFHATLAQLFFVLLCAIVLLTSAFWQRFVEELGARAVVWRSKLLPNVVWLTAVLVLFQLVLGATMRHQHAGLAIPDFPLAYGKVWPETDSASVERYNAQRMEIAAAKPITAFQVQLQMVHRIVAVVILAAIAASVLLARKEEFRLGYRVSLVWLGLVLTQATLGAATIWSKKAADIATAHVMVGALLLAAGGILSIITLRSHLFAASSRLVSSAPREVMPAGLAPGSAK
jgi:cytochrome c oxidase assembly protein subunit 15